MSSDPLENLVVDSAAIDRAAIAEAIRGYVGIDNDSGSVVTSTNFKALSQPQQVLAFLLGTKASVLLGRLPQEGLTPAQVATETGIAAGTVRRLLPELARARKVSKDSNGRYFVAHHQVNSVISALQTTT